MEEKKRKARERENGILRWDTFGFFKRI